LCGTVRKDKWTHRGHDNGPPHISSNRTFLKAVYFNMTQEEAELASDIIRAIPDYMIWGEATKAIFVRMCLVH
jgi:hypothetical protein